MQLTPRVALIGALSLTHMIAGYHLFGQQVDGVYSAETAPTLWAAESSARAALSAQLGLDLVPLGTTAIETPYVLNDDLRGDSVFRGAFLRSDDLMLFGKFGGGKGLFQYDPRFEGSLTPSLVEK